jgi:membrane-associated phospholipid phosphatase
MREHVRKVIYAAPRWVLALIVFGANIIYLITNRLLTGGIVPRIPLDEYIPLWPIWTIPYLLLLPYWLLMLVIMTLKMDEPRFRWIILAAMVSQYISVAAFILFPTYIERPILDPADSSQGLIAYLYSMDHVNNALPSMHMSLTTLIALGCWGWLPKLRWFWAATIPITIASTLFTKQHYVLDLVAGILLACAAYILAGILLHPDRSEA